MHLVRALNDLDIVSNPLENGIASKQLMYDVTRNFYENDKEFKSLSDEEKELFVKEHMTDYLISHNDKLNKKFLRASSKTREDLKEFCNVSKLVSTMPKDELTSLIKNNSENINFGIYIIIYKYLSSLQSHLMCGSFKMTDWISTSTSLEKMLKYYDEQDIHKVAVINSDTNGFVDSDNIMTIDLSEDDRIIGKDYLCNKIDIDDNMIKLIAELSRMNPLLMLKFKKNVVNKTMENSRGFKYAKASREICMLRYIPEDHIASVFEQLQIDLIRAELFNFDFLNLSKEKQKEALDYLKKALYFLVVNSKDPFLKHVFDELYINNKNVKDMSSEVVEHNRSKILSLAREVPNIQIKR